MQRIQLGNTVFEGENDVYVFDGETTALIDTGVSLPAVRDELRSGLSDLGISFGDVDEIFLTHWHPDHSGLAGEIQAASGATVRIHGADAPLIDGSQQSLLEDPAAQRAQFDAWGLPEAPRAELQAFLGNVMEDLRGEPVDTTPLSDGETFAVNGTQLTAVHLPGHTAGSVAYEFETEEGDPSNRADRTRRREAFVGDIILPEYTPNVGGADTRVEDPLGTYVESLVSILERDWSRAWPGHRYPIDDPAARAATILEHHRRRTQRVVDSLREEGPADVWTMSARLFGDLENIHILHGPGEAAAHLDHLQRAGIVERDDDGEYTLCCESPDVDALFPAPARSSNA
ncbi:beta-lactamase domain protein [Halalkaliarchaeum desulfuricum]|uniref:Beta-lactamase domain protein n=1 Tax=Halalkaliarchaeum desulfuricum TaxID=2055893 RepID=A0A343TG02_9EURY|nr:MBL fold metallo-hydrolase [Halalkaliarchaeum desulfuricum]AUX08024.1 beta-lactamase domain protein [Halalkaliarchaeum desulfuricum]